MTSINIIIANTEDQLEDFNPTINTIFKKAEVSAIFEGEKGNEKQLREFHKLPSTLQKQQIKP